MQINISDLVKKYDDKVILNWVNLSLNKPLKIAIIWPNGSGKSTFFKLLSNKEKPNSGWISVKGNLLYIRQEVNNNILDRSLDRYFSQFVEDREYYKIYDALEQMWISDVDLNTKIWQLSGWQQRKLDFARIFLERYEILLLDEPTNHIDHSTKNRLIDLISNFKGIVFCISHDRQFINNRADQVCAIENNNITIYDGDYDDYIETKLRLDAKKQTEYELRNKKKQKMEKRLSLMTERASFYDSPALGSLLRNKKRFYEKELIGKEPPKNTKNKNINIHFDSKFSHSKILLEMKKYNLCIGEKILIQNINIELYSGQKILILWENWVGKTTLIHRIKNYLTDFSDRYNSGLTTIDHEQILDYERKSGFSQIPQISKVSQIPQISQISKNKQSHIKITNNLKIWVFDQRNVIEDDQVWPLNRLEKHCLTWTSQIYILWNLKNIWIPEENYSKPIKNLSYGQRVKLKFVQMMTMKHNLLILDEPTNHLDIETIESLENMILDYASTMIVISHDDYFVKQIGIDNIYEIADEKLIVK